MRVTVEKAYNISLSRVEVDSLVLIGYSTGQVEYEEFAARRNAKQPGSILPRDDVMDMLLTLNTASN